MHNIIGSLSAILTTIAFIPQVIKVIKSKNTKDISLAMYILFTIGVAGWFIYGLMLDSFPIITANIIVFILSSVILFYKIRYK